MLDAITFFREHIDGLLAEVGVTGLPWLVLPVDELERLHPHLAVGIELGATGDSHRILWSGRAIITLA